MLKSKTVFTICITLLFTVASPLFAFDEDDLQKLRKTNKCERCDLSDAHLPGANLRGANLEGANLSGATWTDGSKCRENSIGHCEK